MSTVAALLYGKNTNASSDLYSAVISNEQMQDIINIYNTEPTIQACKGALSAVLSASTLTMGDENEDATGNFSNFLQKCYLPFASAAMDYIRMFGFVVYTLVKEGPHTIPNVVPFGTYKVEIAITTGFRTVLRASSTISHGSNRSARMHVYTVSMPSMKGVIQSPVASLAVRITSQGLLMAAAVESDLNVALPTLITQTVPDRVGAAVEFSRTELEGFFDGQASDILAEEQSVENQQGLNMLARQQELAGKINADTVGNKSLGKAALHAGVMCLPKQQQLANYTTQQTSTNIAAMREDLSRQICSAMGVPLGLLDPSATSMHNESLTCKVFSTYLAKQAHIVQDLISEIYQQTFNEKKKRSRFESSTPFTLVYQSFVASEDLYAAYDREVIDEKEIRIQIARNLGMKSETISKKPRVSVTQAKPSAAEAKK